MAAAGGFGSFLSGRGSTFLSILEWQIVGQILSAILAPELSGVQQEFQKLNPTSQLAVADVVEAVVKGHMTLGAVSATGNTPEAEARLSGLGSERLGILVDSAGEPIPLDLATEAWRRGIIPLSSPDPNVPSLEKAIRDSRLKNLWTPAIEAMQFRLPDPGAIIEGWVRAQISEPAARKFLYQQGIDDATATLLHNVAGRPLSPQEALELYRRGEIPLDDGNPQGFSLRQIFLETDLKDKYWPIWQKLLRYIPPPRTVTAMVREGAFTDAQAVGFYKDAGLDEVTAAAYLEAAHHQRTSAAKETSRATWLALYRDRLASAAQVTAGLEAEGYQPATVAYELEVVDFVREVAYVNKALAKLGALYVAHKLDKTTASASMASLGLDQAAIDHQLRFWDQERTNNVAILSAAQIGELVKLGWLSFESGANLLQGHGYSVADSELYLIAHLKLAPGDPSLPTDLAVSPS